METLQEKLKAITAQCEAIESAAQTMGRDLTQEEFDKIESLVKEGEGIKAEIEAVNARKSVLDKAKGLKSFGEAPAPKQSQAKAHIEVKEGFEEDPKGGFKSHREFLSAVMRAENGVSDQRLEYFAAVGSDEHSGGDSSRGGFLIPTAFSNEILTTSPEANPIANLTRKIPMDSTSVKIPARVDKNHSSSVSGGLTVSRSAETIEKTSSRTQLERIGMEANSLFGVAFATEELLADSPSTFMALVSSGFQDEISSKLFDEILNGTGVGEYEGIMNNPAVVSVAKETGQSAATIVFENIANMRARCWGFNRAVWLANYDCLPTLAQMKQTVGASGVPAWQASARDGEPDRLWGRPIYFTEYTETVGTNGDIVLANFSEYLEGEYQPLQNAESIHVRFLNHERAFKFWMRNDGRGWWRSALTPKKGANTLSPFVTLATRA